MARRSIKVNWFYNTLSGVLKVLFPLVTAPYIARVLLPDGVGLFNFANSYVAYFVMFAALGVPTYAVREIAKVRDDPAALRRLTNELFSVTVFSTIAVSIPYLLSIALVPQLSANFVIFLVIGFVLYLSPLSVDWFYSGLEDFKYIALRSMAVKTVCVISLFLFVKTRDDVLIYTVINVVNNVANNIWNCIKMSREGFRPRLVTAGLRRHLRPSLILLSSSVAVSVYNLLDTLMLGFMRDYSQVAFYTSASNVAKMLVSLLTSLAIVTVPRVSAYLKDGAREEINRLTSSSFAFIILISVPAAVGLCCLSRDFVPLFYGESFAPASAPLAVMSFVMVAIGLSSLAGTQILIAMGLDKDYLWSILAGAVLNFAANCFVIPRYGATGAALTSVAAEFVIFMVMMRFVRRHTFVRPQLSAPLLKSLAGAALLVPLAIVLRRALGGWAFVLVYVAAGAAAYIVAEVLLRHEAIPVLASAVIGSLRKNGLINNNKDKGDENPV